MSNRGPLTHEDILARFPAQPRVKHRRGMKVLCPAHADEGPSLYVGPGDSQPCVLHCYAGCSVESILAATALTFADICKPNGTRPMKPQPKQSTVPPHVHGPNCGCHEARDGVTTDAPYVYDGKPHAGSVALQMGEPFSRRGENNIRQRMIVETEIDSSTPNIQIIRKRLITETPPPKAPREPDTTDFKARALFGNIVAIHRRIVKPDGEKVCPWYYPDGVTSGLPDGLHPESFALYDPAGDAGDALLGTFTLRPLVITEGEPAAIALYEHGGRALGTYGTGATPSPEVLEQYSGETIYLWADADLAGREHMYIVARRLIELGCTVRWIDWREAGFKQDAADFFQRGGTDADLMRMIADARRLEAHDGPPPPPTADKDDTAEGKDKRSIATRLVDLAKVEGVELTHDEKGRGWVTYPVGNHRETSEIQGTFAKWLRGKFYAQEKTAADPNALATALGTLAADAEFASPEAKVYLRVAQVGGNIYIDLGDPDWRVVEVSKTGWRVLNNSPVKFCRPDDTESLPYPVRGGTVDDLRPFLNIGDSEWVLLKGFLVTALQDTGPMSILVLKGRQGTGKSTTCRMVARFIDPRERIPGAAPKDIRDLVAAAKGCRLPTYDNVSHLSVDVADHCCRLATGVSFAERELYTNFNTVGFKAKRPQLFNGIAGLAETRGHILSRATVLELDVIPPGQYETEAAIWEAFEEAAPRIFDRILDALVVGLQNTASVRAQKMHSRMADLEAWAIACEPALNLRPGEYMRTREANLAGTQAAALDSHPLYPLIRQIANSGGFDGYMGELHKSLEGFVDERSRRHEGWPRTPGILSSQLDRLAPNLTAVGIEIAIGKHTKHGTPVTIANVKAPGSASPASPASPAKAKSETDAAASGDFDGLDDFLRERDGTGLAQAVRDRVTLSGDRLTLTAPAGMLPWLRQSALTRLVCDFYMRTVTVELISEGVK